MLADDVLLYAHNNPPAQQDAVVRPIMEALRRHWSGDVLVAHVRDVSLQLGRTPATLINGVQVLPGRTFARTFTSTYACLVARSLERLGSIVLNSTAAHELATSKFETALVLTQANIPVPEQMLFPSGTAEAGLGGHHSFNWPQVVKADAGMGGSQVWLAHSTTDVASLSHDEGPARPWVAQQFRRDAKGEDVRVLVINGRVCAQMLRRAAPGDFRSNMSQGGTALATTLSAQEEQIALAAAAATGLLIGGIDILRTQEGPMVTEVNANPNLMMMTALSGNDDVYDEVAAAICA